MPPKSPTAGARVWDDAAPTAGSLRRRFWRERARRAPGVASAGASAARTELRIAAIARPRRARRRPFACSCRRFRGAACIAGGRLLRPLVQRRRQQHQRGRLHFRLSTTTSASSCLNRAGARGRPRPARRRAPRRPPHSRPAVLTSFAGGGRPSPPPKASSVDLVELRHLIVHLPPSPWPPASPSTATVEASCSPPPGAPVCVRCSPSPQAGAAREAPRVCFARRFR